MPSFRKRKREIRVATVDMFSSRDRAPLSTHDGSLNMHNLDAAIASRFSCGSDVRILNMLDKKIKNRYTNLYRMLPAGLSKREFESNWRANLPQIDNVSEEWKRKLMDVDWNIYSTIQECDNNWLNDRFKCARSEEDKMFLLERWIRNEMLDVVCFQNIDTSLLHNLCALLSKIREGWRYVEDSKVGILYRSDRDAIQMFSDEITNVVIIKVDNCIIASALLTGNKGDALEFARLMSVLGSFACNDTLMLCVRAHADICYEVDSDHTIIPANGPTTNMQYTHMQFEYQPNKTYAKSENFIVTNSKRVEYKVSQLNGTNSLDLIPNDAHPFDHYAVMASIRVL